MSTTQGQQICEWFANCQNYSDGVIEHETLGDVPICIDCYRKGSALGWPATYFIPPMAARALRPTCVDCQRPLQGDGPACPDCNALALRILQGQS